MSLISINWKPAPKDLREFGVIVLIGLGIMGGVAFWRGNHGAAYGMWTFGVVSGVLGLTGNKIALPFYWGWMGLGFVMGNIMGRLMMAAFFYVVVGGMGLVMKLVRRDRLALRKPQSDTHWQDCPIVADVEHYQRQS